jgi:hypothetical protein
MAAKNAKNAKNAKGAKKNRESWGGFETRLLGFGASRNLRKPRKLSRIVAQRSHRKSFGFGRLAAKTAKDTKGRSNLRSKESIFANFAFFAAILS